MVLLKQICGEFNLCGHKIKGIPDFQVQVLYLGGSGASRQK